MATAVTLPKTIFITTLPAASVSSNSSYNIQCQNGALTSSKIGIKRSYSSVSSPTSISLSQSPPITSLTTNDNSNLNGNVWIPATVQRTFKYETIDEDYSYEENEDYMDGHYVENGQPPRKRERLTHLTPEEKMFRRKMKNRIAAQTARDRKKALMVDLEDTCRRLEEENDSLVIENTKLRQEQSSLAQENERLKKLLSDKKQQQDKVNEDDCRSQEDVRLVEAVGPAEGASQDRMGVDLVNSIRSDPNLLNILRNIVSGSSEIAQAIGAIKTERQFDIGGCNESLSTGGNGEIMGHHTVSQTTDGYETAVSNIPNQISPSNNDHEYFNNSSPISPSSSILFSSNSPNDYVDFESLLQPQTTTITGTADLFSTDDTADCNYQQYLITDSLVSSVEIDTNNLYITSTSNTTTTGIASPNGAVPTSPKNMAIDSDFPTLSDDVLEEALKNLGDFNDLTENASTFSNSIVNIGSTNEIAFDFLQNDDDDYNRDLSWEESFAELFPSLSNA